MAFSALRLAVGTLTVVPVGELPEIDRRMGGRAMLLAPLAAVPLAAAVAVVGGLAAALGLPELVTGLLLVGVLALGTRALHLDGLADTADGLGSGWSPERSLTIMKRGDVGPMGVVTLVVVLGLQAAALGALVDGVPGALLAAVIVCASRAALALVCRRGVPAARHTGLGVVVANTVPGPVAGLVWLGVAAGLSAAYGAALGRWWLGLAAAGLAAALVLVTVRHCHRRLGGVTGDVMGAAIEIGFTTMLICAAVR